MLVHRKHDSKLYLGFRPVLFFFFKTAFCLEGRLCEGGSFVIFFSFGLLLLFCEHLFYEAEFIFKQIYIRIWNSCKADAVHLL